MIKIGNTLLETQHPEDLSARCITATGCSDAELIHFLGRQPSAHLIAQALAVMLVDDSPADLIDQIVAAGNANVSADVVALLRGDEPMINQGDIE